MRSIVAPLAVLSLALGACGGEDTFSPTTETVAGSYAASAFTVTSSTGTTDLLANGATVTIVLATDGSTTGRLFVPAGAEGRGDLDVDLAGTWTLAGSSVTFAQGSDTFVRDVAFTAGRNSLTGNGTFSGETIHLILVKTG
jgi:hypothetical protein